MKRLKYIMLSAAAVFCMAACDHSETINPVIPEPALPTDWFAKGADVGWVTEMEAAGRKFYNSRGTETECISLLKSLGVNSIRLRAWVDPDNGWQGTEDLLIKAWRAHNLGMRIMIDFHYSDWWADPGKQIKPKAWIGMSLEEMTEALSEYTKDVLRKLKAIGVTPEWVQVGNETTHGMLYNDEEDVDTDPASSGSLSANGGANYAKLNNAGYDAVKEIFPNAKVVVHVDRGHNEFYMNRMMETLKNNGGKVDVLGLSLYPAVSNWQTLTDNCINNMQAVIDTYDVEVMLCEVGMEWEDAEECELFLEDIMSRTRQLRNQAGENRGGGVFYWEPQSYGWNNYSKGAFTPDGAPTVAMDAFKVDYTK